MKKLIYLILLFPAVDLFPQQFNFLYSFGEFESASSFIINPSGIIYITDGAANEVYSYDTTGTFLKETGGYGWEEDTFDDPVDISASSLNVYVCDKNNHRIQRYDKDLNYISQLSTRNENNFDMQFGYPLSCTASPQGDLYILDSENKRILKFDVFGKFVQNFGGYDTGEFALQDPVKLAVSPVGYVYVLDNSGFIIFDQYGNGIAKLDLDESIINFNIIFNHLTFNSEAAVYHMILNSAEKSFKEFTLVGLDAIPSLQSSLIFNNKLYLLTEKDILVFESIKSN